MREKLTNGIDVAQSVKVPKYYFFFSLRRNGVVLCQIRSVGLVYLFLLFYHTQHIIKSTQNQIFMMGNYKVSNKYIQILDEGKMEKNKFDEDISNFQMIKNNLPEETRQKLEYMLRRILNNQSMIEEINEDQKQKFEDINQLNSDALKIVFSSIVASMTNSKLYSSFQKQCKIKIIKTNWLSKNKYIWSRAYIDFGEDFVSFNKIGEKLKFPLKGLILQGQKTKNPTTIDIWYKNKPQARVKFDHNEACESFIAKIQYLKKCLRKDDQDEKNRQKFEQYLVVSFENDPSYLRVSKNKNMAFYSHKKQPKIYAQFFIKQSNLSFIEFITCLLIQKTWNKKIKSQVLKDTGEILEDLVIERKYKSFSSFGNQRKTFTKIDCSYLPEMTTECYEKFRLTNNNPKYLIKEEDVSNLAFSEKKQSKFAVSSIKSSLNIAIVIEILGNGFYKIQYYAQFDGRGHYSQSDSRSAIKYMLSDLVFLPDYFNKQKKIDDKSKDEKSILVGKLKKKLQGSKSRIDFQKCQPEEPKLNKFKSMPQINLREEEVSNYEIDLKNQEEVHEDQEEEFFETIMDMDDAQGYGEQVLDQLESEDNSSEENRIQNQQPGRRQTYTNLLPINQALQEMKRYMPKNPTDRIKIQYLKLLKEKQEQKYYINSQFSQNILQNPADSPPWYCPSLMLNSGKQYKANQNNELVYINYQLINKQKDSLIFVIKQLGANILKGKSIMNISLPVDIFESRSLLERSAASFGCVPKYLANMGQADILTQMKSVTRFAFSVPPMELIMEKPFNPILGETFEALIGGIPIYYEQISHHPPISSYYMKSEDFQIYGNLIAVAQVGLNSGSGRNAGVMNIIMKNGSHFLLIFPPAEISGLIYGSRKYKIFERSYVIQKKHCLMTEIASAKQSKGLYENTNSTKLTTGDVIGGIFETTQAFMNKLNPFAMKGFSGLAAKDIKRKIVHISGIWYEDLMFDGQNCTNNTLAYPVEYPCVSLPSNSNFRLDIMFHRLGDLARSQIEKEALENIQRSDKKLREKFKK